MGDNMKTISNGMVDWKVNGIKVNTSIPSSSANYNNNSSRSVSYVVMHYTGNSKDTANNNATYFKNGSRSASAHFFVDDSDIYQSVELRDTAWHCGCTQGYKNDCRNTNSIGIEMCCTAGNYKISTKTKKNAAYLCAKVCELVGIKYSDVDKYVLRHYDVVKSNKKCPAQFVDNSSEWTEFKKWIVNILRYGNIDGASTTTSSSSTSELYRVRKTWADASSQLGAYSNLDNAKSACKSGYSVFDSKGKVVYTKSNSSSTTSTTTTTNKSIPTVAKPTIQNKSTGTQAKYLQQDLNYLGFRGADGKALTVDGDIGTNSVYAIKQFQKKYSLVVDGIYGQNSYNKMKLLLK